MMNTPQHHRAHSIRGAGLVWGLVALAVAVLALGWALSPVVQTRLTSLWADHFEWSPPQIRQDPAGFTRHAQSRAEDAIEEARAHRIRIHHTRLKNDRKLTEADAKAEAARELLEEHRDAYLAADDSDWPVDVAGASYTEQALRSQIVALKRSLDFYSTETAQRGELQQEYQQRLHRAQEAERRGEQLLTQLARLEERRRIEDTELELDDLEDIADLVHTVDSYSADSAPSSEALIEDRQRRRQVEHSFDEILELDLDELY